MKTLTARKIQKEEDLNFVSLASLRLKKVIMNVKLLKDKEKGKKKRRSVTRWKGTTIKVQEEYDLFFLHLRHVLKRS